MKIMLNCPVEERPREKAIYYGIETLSNQELVAVILRTGNKEMSVLNLAQFLLDEIGGFQELKDIDYQRLIQIKGIKQAKAIELMACIELAKRMQSKQSIKNRIRQPKDAYAYIKNKLMFEKQEKVILLCLNNHLEIVQDKLLFIGSGDVSLLETKEVFQYTLRSGCNRIILIHNHPSGNPKPSHEDQEITRKIEMMAKHLDIEFIDHIIVGDHCYYSFKSNQIYQSKED
ncbi:JAB domain-containing protein [Coprobacillus sp. AF34-1BH]|nr:JAB domain-containing protein [Coprobacillus sp. AF18-40]RGT86367.1 JAB domain-containing protein [Coprobacillus sp. AF18-15LB]RHB08054.1 JAB domain-containing protein [Coprobacillus sp. AM42-12AC]RHP27633.1 JAB domain-containing protein [Coprobacillus sp. AF34-1BH]RHQ88296.1 JAB domain-containing protein [Coprobacillus sp. AF21-8LB]